MMSSETNIENNRIQILKEILLDLHHGASPESVQELFNQHFKGVSALEISMMEHELMASEDGVTFEDVMRSSCLCFQARKSSPTFSYTSYPSYHRKHQ